MKLTKEQLDGIEGTFEYLDALEAEDIVRNQRMLLDHIQAIEEENERLGWISADDKLPP